MNHKLRALLGGGGDFSGYTRLSALLPSMSLGDPLVLGSDTKLLVDVEMDDADALGQITNDGEIRFDHTRSTRLLADGIWNTGSFWTHGQGLVPHPADFRIDLCGARPTVSGNLGGGALKTGLTHDASTDVSTGNNGTTNDNMGVSRGLVNSGGIMRLQGQSAPLARRLNAHYASGTTLTLDAPITCAAGAEIWVSPTGFYNASTRTEKRIVAATVLNSTTVTITVALSFARWGLLQYATDTGISTTNSTWSTYKAHASMSNVIDQRAFVIVRDRTGIIAGVDVNGNTDLATYGYGFHQMTMGIASKTLIKNVQHNDYGQKALLGRYGIHAHLTAYNMTTGALLLNPNTGLTDGKFASGDCRWEANTFGDGHSRVGAMHACKGVEWVDNSSYGAQGHAFFEEDGSEVENEMTRNVALRTDAPAVGSRLKVHDVTAAGFWFAHPNNTHVDNWGVDGPRGWWNAFSYGLFATRDASLAASTTGCLGASAVAVIRQFPFWGIYGTWNGNAAFCTAGQGGTTDEVPNTNSGAISGQNWAIAATTDGLPTNDLGTGTDAPVTLVNARLFKCVEGYVNRVKTAGYSLWICADNYYQHLRGATNAGSASKMLVIRESLNHESHALSSAVQQAFASYHNLLDFVDISAYGYSGGTPAPFGALGEHGPQTNQVLQTYDLYTDPLHDLSVNDTNWKLYQSYGAYQAVGPSLKNDNTLWDVYQPGGVHFSETIAGNNYRFGIGILFDKFGHLASNASGSLGTPEAWIIPNLPFYTTGAGSTTALPSAPNSESVVSTARFWGVYPYETDTWNVRRYGGFPPGCKFLRVNTSGVDIAGATVEYRNNYEPTDIDPFTGVTAVHAQQGIAYWDFHHCALPRSGIVRFIQTDIPAPLNTRFGADIYKLPSTTEAGALSTDYFILGISWAAATVPVITLTGFDPTSSVSITTTAASMAALIATAGRAYWRDTANNMLWMKLTKVNMTGYWAEQLNVTS